MYYCLDDWKSDQYRWANNGVIKLPRSKPLVQKSYFSIDTPEGRSNDFTRHVYVLLGKDDKVSYIHMGSWALGLLFTENYPFHRS